jgi:hypothetical protein
MDVAKTRAAIDAAARSILDEIEAERAEMPDAPLTPEEWVEYRSKNTPFVRKSALWERAIVHGAPEATARSFEGFQ